MKKKLSTKKVKKPKVEKITTKSPTSKKTTNQKQKTKLQISKKQNSKIVKPLTLREKKIQGIKKRLISQKEALLSEAEEALNELPGQTTFPDLGDQASAETDRNFMLRLRGREQRLLKKIENALDRIEQGIFGICEKCGEVIDLRRLDARPVTTMCIDCKTQQEEEEKLKEL
jgi:DnaK suppressor protein